MDSNTFFDNFGHLADAPNGIQKLRELILQLAVRGKLVPQDPADEPASKLLERIKAEKARLVKEKKIRKVDPLPPVKADEAPFELPQGWEWVMLGDLGAIGSSSRVHQKDWTSKGIPFLRAREIVQLSKHGFVNNELYITEELFLDLRTNGLVPEVNDVMITGVGTIGVPYVVKAEDKFYFKDASVLIFKNYFRIFPKFLECVFKSPYWKETIHENSMGTTVHTLTISRATEVPVPLAPPSEQHRIVTKVEQLMALCDELEARQQKRQRKLLGLNNAALHGLTSATDADGFAAAWKLVRDSFDLLYTTPETIAKLRQTILQLAVQGKLVPQDPTDEPASKLLERIRAEKTRLLKEKKIPKGDLLPPVTPEEMPFELPQGWEWVRLGDLGVWGGGGTPSKAVPSYWSGEIPWVSPKDMKRAEISDSIDHVSLDAVVNSAVKLIQEGSLLMVVRGMILIHSFPVAINLCEVTINQDMKALSLHVKGGAAYLQKYLWGQRDQLLQLVERSSHGTCRIDSGRLSSFVVGLPPVAEQIRIVAKVQTFTALCDQLEASLAGARGKAERVTTATVQAVLAA